jgi:LysR family carnitine catabolism transcriptional activator
MKQGLRHIRAFLCVAELGSFTRAAQALHVSQPALTVQIRQLEDELQVRLFDRDPRHVRLTTHGRKLQAPLQRVLSDFEQALVMGRELAGLQRGELTLAVLPSIAADWLPALMRHYRQAHPGVHLHIADVPADRIQAMVADESADLGLGPWVHRDRAIRFDPLGQDRLQVFFPPEHVLAGSRQPTLRQVAQHPQILTARGSSVRLTIQQALQAEQLSVETACEVAYISTAIGMVKAGLGVALLPLSARQAANCGELLHRPVRSRTLSRQLGVLSRRLSTPTPAVLAFRKLLADLRQNDGDDPPSPAPG